MVDPWGMLYGRTPTYFESVLMDIRCPSYVGTGLDLDEVIYQGSRIAAAAEPEHGVPIDACDEPFRDEMKIGPGVLLPTGVGHFGVYGFSDHKVTMVDGSERIAKPSGLYTLAEYEADG